MKKILPVKYPIVTSYPVIANLMAMLGTDERAVPWICSNFFNQLLYLRKPKYSAGTTFEQQAREHNLIYSEIPLLNYNKIKKEVVNAGWDKFTEFVIDCINKDYYIHTHLDNYHLSCNLHCYHNKHYLHATLIYGYDLETNVVHIADFYNGDKYDFYTVSIEDIEAAYVDSLSAVTDYCNDIHLIKFNEQCQPIKINIPYLKRRLADYLNCEDNTKKYEDAHRWEEYTLYYGLSYYDEMIKNIISGNLNPATKTTMHILYDHSVIMEYKVNALYNAGIIVFESQYHSLKNDIEQIKQSAYIARNFYLKFLHSLITSGLSKKEAIISKLAERYKALKEMSRNFTQKFIDILELSMNPPVIDENYNLSITDDISEWKPLSGKIAYSPHQTVMYPTADWKGGGIDLGKAYTETVDINYDITLLKSTACPVIGFAHKNAVIADYTDIPVLMCVRDNNMYFEVFNGHQYFKDSKLLIELNKTYHVRIHTNVLDKNYSVYVTDELGEETQIAKEYRYSAAALVPENIGSYICEGPCSTPHDYEVRNLTVNGDIIKNTNDNALNIENGSAVHALNTDSDKIMVELSVKLDNAADSASITLMSGEMISANIDLTKDNATNNEWNLVKLIAEEGACNVYLNGTIVKQNVPLGNIDIINAVKVSTNGIIFLKNLIVKA